jgi:hypothetical protein
VQEKGFVNMTASETFKAGGVNMPKPTIVSGKTIDLQGVASFAGLVELLAQELGTQAGRIQGLLPSGPASFEELVGEISLNNQGFIRNLALVTKPGAPLKLRFQCQWRTGQPGEEVQMAPNSGVEAHFFLDATVEQIVPQGRALARYIEDTFAIMDRMVTLGQANRLSTLSISAAEIAAFENSLEGALVQSKGADEEPAAGANASFKP